jgi:hypothetical protein
MNPLLVRTAIFFNKTAAWLQAKNHLHTSRFAHNFELSSLMSNTLDRGGLMIGEGAYRQFLQVCSTRERRELRNMLIVARQSV